MTSSSKNSTEQAINEQLDFLLSSFNGNKNKLREIIESFINETPLMFDEIDNLIAENKLKEASKLIHKTKTRFGYLGLDEDHKILSDLEDKLGDNFLPKNISNLLDNIKTTNMSVMEILEKSPLYKEDIIIDESNLPLAGKLVLVAEDDEINAMVFELFIQETGAEVIIANDGNEALKLTLERRPDFIFMDVHMPYFSGIDSITELRKKGIDCPIISLSASTRLNEQIDSVGAGANDFIVKPVNKIQIHQALFQYLK